MNKKGLRGLLQANAEPDLQQTGSRLKPVVAGLLEGIMQLVVDPLAQSQVPLFFLSFQPSFVQSL